MLVSANVKASSYANICAFNARYKSQRYNGSTLTEWKVVMRTALEKGKINVHGPTLKNLKSVSFLSLTSADAI